MARTFRNKKGLAGVSPIETKKQYRETPIRLGKKVSVFNRRLTKSPTKYHTSKLLKKREGFSSVSRNIYTGRNPSQGISRNMSSVKKQSMPTPTTVVKKSSVNGSALATKAIARAAKALKTTLLKKKSHENERKIKTQKKIMASRKEDAHGRKISEPIKYHTNEYISDKNYISEGGVYGSDPTSGGGIMSSGPKGGTENVPGPEAKSPKYKLKKQVKEGMTPGRKRLADILKPNLDAMETTVKKLEQNAKDYAAVVKKYPAKPVTEDNQSEQDSILKNPGYLHNDFNSALTAAKNMNEGETDQTSRAYVLHDKYYYERKTKPYVVVNNKQLTSQEPNWDQKGYTVKAWVSPVDGIVTRTQDGKYVKGTQQ